MSTRGLFITGTDTDAGKTFVGSRLAGFLHESGVNVTPRKPAESGCVDDSSHPTTLLPADALAYAQAVHAENQLDAICPFRFRAPLAPPMAAEVEGKDLTLEMLAACCSVTNESFLIAEGAGGFYSPVARDGLNADLAQKLGLPVLLVAADRLGCINHILLSLEAIERRGLTIAAVVLSRTQPADENSPDNLPSLMALTTTPVLNVGYQPSGAELIRCFSALRQHLNC